MNEAALWNLYRDNYSDDTECSIIHPKSKYVFVTQSLSVLKKDFPIKRVAFCVQRVNERGSISYLFKVIYLLYF